MSRDAMRPGKTSRMTRRATFALPMLAITAPSASASVTLVDVLGRTVTLPKPAERIVVCFYADEFAAIAGPGGWDRVVGLGKRQWVVNRSKIWERYRAAVPRLDEIADVGADEDNTLSSEKILSLRPDLVIAPPWMVTGDRARLGPVESAGIPIVAADFNSQSVERHVAGTRAIGAAIGVSLRAQQIADLYASRVADTVARAKSAGRRPKVYVEIGMGGAGVVGNSYMNTMWGRMLDNIGADNIANGAIPSGFNPMAPEKVLAAQPDYIFITGSSWSNQPNAVRLGYDVDIETARASLRPYLQRPGWGTLPAVIAGNVFTIEHTLTRSLMDFISLQFIAKQLYPEQFRDADPVQSLREYHEKYLPVTFSGTWMARLT